MYIDAIARMFGCGPQGCSGAHFPSSAPSYRQQDISIGQIAMRTFLILATALSGLALFASGHPLAFAITGVFAVWTLVEFLGIDSAPTPIRTHQAAHPVILHQPPQLIYAPQMPTYAPQHTVPATFYITQHSPPRTYVTTTTTTATQRAPVGRNIQGHPVQIAPQHAAVPPSLAVSPATAPILTANNRAPVGRTGTNQPQIQAAPPVAPPLAMQHPHPGTARAPVGRRDDDQGGGVQNGRAPVGR